MLEIPIPGSPVLELEHLLLDVNGTLTNRGAVLPGIRSRIPKLTSRLQIRLVSADTFGTLDELARSLQVAAVRVSAGAEKHRLVDELGSGHCGVIGNGANDALALEASALGIAIIGPEGASSRALRAADLVCASVIDALDLLLDPKALAATLRT